MTDPTSESQISIAGRVLDPFIEQTRQAKDDDPIDPKRVLPWIVQFQSVLDEAARGELLRAHSTLRLTEYVPPRCYVESLAGQAVGELLMDPRVRAVMRMTSELKVSSRLRESDKDDEPTPAAPTDVILLDTPDVSAVVDAIRALLPADGVLAVIDDRQAGGALLVRVNANPAVAQRIAALDDVRWVEGVPETVDDSLSPGDDPTSTRHSRVGQLPAAVRLDLTGSGQVVGMIDKGPPDIGHCFFLDREHEQPGPMHRKIVARRNGSGTGPGDHSTFTSGIVAGDDIDQPGAHRNRGIAWGARLVCGNRVDLDGATSLLAEFAAAADAGAFIHSNSWHSKPQGSGLPATYDRRSADVDAFTWTNEDHVVVGSSGNVGEEQGPPGTAKNAICVSATVAQPGLDESDQIGDGNGGPTLDGRRKPDVTGVGCGVHSAILATPCGTGPKSPCASSYATPWVAAIIALVRQQLTEGRWRDGQPRPADAFVPSGALLRAILLNSAVARGPEPGIPSKLRGWGEVQPTAALGQQAPRLLTDVRNADGLHMGDTFRLPFTVVNSELLTATLVWTEPPGAIGSDRCVVNHLDLRLHTPAGDVIRANTFADGQTATTDIADPANSTQMIIAGSAPVGEWVAEVAAPEVNIGAPGQGFALVLTGSFDPRPSTFSEQSVQVRRTAPTSSLVVN